MRQPGTTASSAPVKRPYFYGYTILIATVLIIFGTLGLRLSYGVFFNPMSGEMGWSSATTALGFSISSIVEGFFNFFLGGLADRIGPRRVLILTGVFIGAGYCLMFFIHNLWQFYLFYGVLVGIGMGGIYVPLITMVTRWFKAKRNLMTGIVAAAGSTGLLVTAPLANRLIYTIGWRSSFLIFGIALFVIIIVAALFLKRDPSTMGLKPYGEPNTVEKSIAPSEGLTFSETIRTRQYWILLAVFFIFAFCIVAITIHLVPDAISNGIQPSTAAYVLTITGVLSAISRISMGVLSDKIGEKSVYLIGFALLALNMFWLIMGHSLAFFVIFAVMFGLAQGGLVTSQSPFLASFFGLKHQGLIFGMAGFACAMGSAAGPYLAGYLFDVTKSYNSTFMLCAALCVLAVIFLQFTRPLKKTEH
jgi:MFS family permease